MVIAVNGRRVEDAGDLRNAVGLLRVGQTVELTVLRKGRERRLRARIDKPPAASGSGAALHPLLDGARFHDLPPQRRSRRLRAGVLVQKVVPDSPAWRAGLRGADVIVSANRQRVENLDDFAEAIRNADSLLLNVRRGQEAFFLAIR